MTHTITHSTGDYRGDGDQLDRWLILDNTCDDPHGIAAGLWVDLVTREIRQIEVTPARQGEGLARALWDAANTEAGPILHAHVAHRTSEGDAFAQAVGGDTAPCTDECCCGDDEEYSC